MIGAAGLTFAIAIGDAGRTTAAALAKGGGKAALSPWVTISTDDTIAIMSPAAEMGQGSLTSLPLILAEELDADWAKVRIVAAPPNDELYKNPAFGSHVHGRQQRGDRLFQAAAPVRRAGPQGAARNAAKHWDVPVDELTTGPSVVVHEKIGPPPDLRRDRRLCRDPGQGAGDQPRAS